MIDRTNATSQIRAALRRAPIVLLLGPRQCGKTTLAQTFVGSGSGAYFDLESPDDLARMSQPMTALAPLRGTIVIDEVQRIPDLFPLLRVLADRKPLPARFLVLGSASPEMLRQSSESLAGRVEIVHYNLKDLDTAWRAFRNVAELWQYLKKYKPYFVSNQ